MAISYNILDSEKLNKIITKGFNDFGKDTINTNRNLTYDKTQEINYIYTTFTINIDELFNYINNENIYRYFTIAVNNAYKYDKIAASNFCIPYSTLTTSQLIQQKLEEDEFYIFPDPSEIYLTNYCLNLEYGIDQKWRIHKNTLEQSGTAIIHYKGTNADVVITKDNANDIEIINGTLELRFKRYFHTKYYNTIKYKNDLTTTSYFSTITKRNYTEYKYNFKTIVKIMSASYSIISADKYWGNYLEICNMTDFPHFFELFCNKETFANSFILYENNIDNNVEDFYNDYVDCGFRHVEQYNYHIFYEYSNIGYYSGYCNGISFGFGGEATNNTFQDYNVDIGNPLAWGYKPSLDSRYRWTKEEYNKITNNNNFIKCKSFKTISCPQYNYNTETDYEFINYITFNLIFKKDFGNILKMITQQNVQNTIIQSMLGLPNSYTNWR